ncbi:MAG: alpha/beta hydrolase family protein [Salibacteraceae bacterium]
MLNKSHHQIPGNSGRPISLDLRFNPNQSAAPVVLFLHGFKGFKDWGHFNLLADRWAAMGMTVVKLNFSHNGTTPENPSDFADLEAFGQNHFGRELDDVERVIDWLASTEGPLAIGDERPLGLVGHSRGGAIAVLHAARDNRVKALATWAAVADLHAWMHRFPVAEWQEKGVIYIPNARTRQQMPLNLDFYKDYMAHTEEYSVEEAARKLKVPHLIVHGDADEAVPVAAGHQLAAWSPKASYLEVEGGGHTFGAGHPPTDIIPQPALHVVQETGNFFLENLI